MSTCCLCGAEASSAESWTGLVAGIPDPVAVCSEACMEQLWWVVDKGPPFGSAVSQPRSGASAVCGPTTRSSEPPSSSQLPTSDVFRARPVRKRASARHPQGQRGDEAPAEWRRLTALRKPS